jgi:hypothetical protein
MRLRQPFCRVEGFKSLIDKKGPFEDTKNRSHGKQKGGEEHEA